MIVINLPTGVKMSVETSVSTDKRYLLFKISGNYNFNDTLDLIKNIRKSCESNKIFKVLIDMSDLKESDMPDIDRFYLGEAISKDWLLNMVGAVVYPPKSINGYVETVARNRFAQFKVLGDKQEAIDWILTDY